MIGVFDAALVDGSQSVVAEIVGPFAIHLSHGTTGPLLSVSHVATGRLVGGAFRSCRQADRFVAELLNCGVWDRQDVGRDKVLAKQVQDIYRRIVRPGQQSPSQRPTRGGVRGMCEICNQREAAYHCSGCRRHYCPECWGKHGGCE